MNNLVEKWKLLKTNDLMLKKSLETKKIVIEDFQKNLDFGTAGIRGIMGAGSNKINELTIARATSAYAQFLLKNYKDAKIKGVIIANDNRHNGFLYKKITSQVLTYYGIKNYVLDSDELMSTPLLSFLIRELKTIGGINITASHNPKNYNGFKVYNQDGAQLMPNYTSQIATTMKKIDLFNVSLGSFKPLIISNKYVEKYINEICKIRFNKKNIKVAFSPLHGAASNLGKKLFNHLGIEAIYVKKQMINDPNFSYIKSSNPEEVKSYDEVLKLAKKTKSDIALVTDPDADRVGVVAKYKRRWKYITGNQIGVLYLDYYLNQLKINKKLPKDGYIVKSLVSTDMINHIAKKYGVEVKEVNVGFKNIADLIKNTKGTFLFGFEESYGFLVDSNIVRDKDGLQGIVGIIDLTAHLKAQNKTLFSRLLEIYKEDRIYRNIQFSKKMGQSAIKRSMDRIIKLKTIGNKKILKAIDFRKIKGQSQQMIKLEIEGGSKVIVRPSGTEPKVKFYIQTVGWKGEPLMHAVILERKIKEEIEDCLENFDVKKFSWKVFLKYFIFVAIVSGLLVFVFEEIYKSYSSKSNVVEESRSLLSKNNRFILLIPLAALLFGILIDALMKWRLLKFHGQKVKLYHIVISSLMGRIISYLTPLSIGGDGIGYWFLRRKGFKRAPLSSTFLTSTILWQMKAIIMTAVLTPMAFSMFKDILFHGDGANKAILVLFIVGISWDMFSILMIWLLVFSKRFQEWIVRTTIKLLEWLWFIRVSDPGSIASGYQYEFMLLRKGMKKIWKSPLILMEAFFYELLPSIFMITAFLPIVMGILNPDLPYGDYFSQIVSRSIIYSANSFSLTPGSVGFIEFITIKVKSTIFVGGNDTAISIDIMNKILFEWPMLLLSAILTIMIIIGESRNKFYKTRIKNISTIKTKTSMYKKIWPIWFIFLGIWPTLLFLY